MNSKPQPNYLTIKSLCARWNCHYNTAYAFMHRRGSGAVKVAGKLQIPLREVERHENMNIVRTG